MKYLYKQHLLIMSISLPRKQIIDNYKYIPFISLFARFSILGNNMNSLIKETSVNCINSKDIYGMTPLMYAVRFSKKYSSYNTVNFLIGKGANINDADNNGETVLMKAIRFSDNDVISLLLYYNADINIKNLKGENSFMISIRYYNKIKNLNLIKKLVPKNIDDNIYLINAIKYYNDEYNTELIEFLISLGVDINKTDKYGNTALMKCFISNSYNCFNHVIDILLKHNASVDIINFNKYSVLELSIIENIEYSYKIFHRRKNEKYINYWKANMTYINNEILKLLFDFKYNLYKNSCSSYFKKYFSNNLRETFLTYKTFIGFENCPVDILFVFL